MHLLLTTCAEWAALADTHYEIIRSFVEQFAYDALALPIETAQWFGPCFTGG